jgi:two-component system, chemotaxis family, protein-glutamate methylesterase/glutaminase
MPGRDIIVIGASAGGLQALEDLVEGLPHDLPASLFIVVHTSPTANGMLPQILTRHSRLPVEFAVDQMRIRPGHIYVARPDQHLLITPGRIHLTRGPKENGFRPAVDPLFRTAARTYGPRVVGVVLSGGLNDGTAGLSIIKQHGGLAIAQDPADASFPSMPLSAVQNVEVDQILPAADIPTVLDELARTPISQEVAAMAKPRRDDEPDIAEEGTASLVNNDRPYPPSPFTCPECGGALWEVSSEGKLLRYRCHVGHGYTGEALEAQQAQEVESALWTALRTLEESAAIRRRLAEQAQSANLPLVEQSYRNAAAEMEDRAAAIRKILITEPGRTGQFPKARPKKRSGAGRTSRGQRGNGEGRNSSPTKSLAAAKRERKK